MFPREPDPHGGMPGLVSALTTFALIHFADPKTWSDDELRRWLRNVRRYVQ